MVFGGAYGNFEALTALRKKAEELNLAPSQIINTGDAVAYCADPVKTLGLLMDWPIHNLAGNVEIQLAGNQQDCGCGFAEGTVCDALSQRWYPYLNSLIRPEHRRWMAALPRQLKFQAGGFKFAAVHGSYTETSRYVFASTPWPVKKEELQLAEADVILAGHCGLPFIDAREGGVWANSGALGLPANDGTRRVWTLLITSEGERIVFQTLPLEYDFQAAQEKMSLRPELQAYADTLTTGFWPSCEVLTPEELKNRGQALAPTRVEI